MLAPNVQPVIVVDDLSKLSDLEQKDHQRMAVSLTQGPVAAQLSKIRLVNFVNTGQKTAVIDRITVLSTSDYRIAIAAAAGGASPGFNLDSRIPYQSSALLVQGLTEVAADLFFAAVPAALTELHLGVILTEGFMLSVACTTVNIGLTVTFFYREFDFIQK